MNRLIPCVLLVLSTLAHANLADVLTATDRSAAEVHAKITAPRYVVTNQLVVVEKAADVVAWEQAALAEMETLMLMVTGTSSNTLVRLALVDTPRLTSLVTQRIMNEQEAATRQAILLQAVKIQAYWQGAQVRGYSWPLPAHFGQAVYMREEQIRVPRPSIWEERFPGQPPPTIEQIRSQLE